MIAIPEDEFAKLVAIKEAAKALAAIDPDDTRVPIDWVKYAKAIEDLKGALADAN